MWINKRIYRDALSLPTICFNIQVKLFWKAESAMWCSSLLPSESVPGLSNLNLLFSLFATLPWTLHVSSSSERLEKVLRSRELNFLTFASHCWIYFPVNSAFFQKNMAYFCYRVRDKLKQMSWTQHVWKTNKHQKNALLFWNPVVFLHQPLVTWQEIPFLLYLFYLNQRMELH